MLLNAMSPICHHPADEDRFESRNLDDSDAHSEATGTTEEDLRPVKVSSFPVLNTAPAKSMVKLQPVHCCWNLFHVLLPGSNLHEHGTLSSVL